MGGRTKRKGSQIKGEGRRIDLGGEHRLEYTEVVFIIKLHT